MHAVKVPIVSGQRWVAQGFGLFRKAPAAIGALAFLFLVCLLFSSVLPMIGAFAPMVLTPILTVGMTDAVRLVDQGESGARLNPLHLFWAFKQRLMLKRLVLLGVVNAAGTVLALGVASLVDDRALFDLIVGSMKQDDPRMRDGSITSGVGVFLLIYTPLQMMLWYAPLLVAWNGMGAVKSCFFSWVAVWRNKWAFGTYAITWMVIALSVSVVLQLLSRTIGAANGLLTIFLVPASLLILSAVYSSYWPAYRDVFQTSTPAE